MSRATFYLKCKSFETFLHVVELEDFLHAVLVLQHLLDARLVQCLVAGREEGNISQVIDGGHNLVPEIANRLVKLVHWPILLFLHGEKILLSIEKQDLKKKEKKRRKEREWRNLKTTSKSFMKQVNGLEGMVESGRRGVHGVLPTFRRFRNTSCRIRESRSTFNRPLFSANRTRNQKISVQTKAYRN
ncbi:hypothetical protein PUN28_005774 [Cardiocondyla obscurior]|uniref:Uncharacterized protein n=1 Tax=Cardiocondyla obscurior TaxID=286306 RepID=A0AAW2G7V9_9HYME